MKHGKFAVRKNIQHHPHFCWSILFSDSFNLWPAYQLANHNDIAQAARITRIAYAMTLLKVQSWTGRIPWFEFTKYAANNKKNGRIWEVLLEIGGCVDILKFYLETWFHICFVFYVWINMYIYIGFISFVYVLHIMYGCMQGIYARITTWCFQDSLLPSVPKASSWQNLTQLYNSLYSLYPFHFFELIVGIWEM